MIPNVTREIGGVNYTLRFSAGTSIAIEREFETKITDLPKMLGDDPNVTKQPMEKLIKLRDRRKQNWQEMQQAAIAEFDLYDEAEKEIKRRLGLL